MGLVSRNTAALMSSVALIVVVGTGASLAQSATTTTTTNRNATNVTLLERIVIGAGAEKVAIDTPQAVTVVNQDDIDGEQATSIGDVLEKVPGITMIGSDRILGESFNIRGIGTAETSGDESKIIITVDGAKKFYEQYRMGSFFSDTELYKQVEVLRGPASSTLYGSGALAGVINFTTKDASDFIADGATGAVRLKGQYTSNGNGTLASGLWAHRVNDTFDILASGNFRRSDVMELANGTALSGSDFESWSGIIKGTARFGESDEQTLRLSYQHWDSEASDQEYNQTGSIAGFGLVDRHVIDKTAVLSYENEDLDNPYVDLKVNLSYSDTTVDQTGSPIGGFANGFYGYRTYQASVENTSEFSGTDWENYLTYGAQLSHQERSGFTNGTGAAIATHPEGTDTKLGLYVQNELVLHDRLTIIPGVRGDMIWQKPSSAVVGGANIEDVAISPKIAAMFDLTDNISIFGSVAHTERFPTLDELYSRSATKRASLQLEKETSNNFEAGFALSGNDLVQAGDQASIKVTGYYNSLTNLIESGPNGTALAPRPYYLNTGKATIHGVEVEGAYESDYIFSRVAYTASFGKNDVTGADLNSIPGHRLVATLGARLPEYNVEFGATATLVAATDAGVVSSALQNSSPPPPAAQPTKEGAPAYQKLDLFASWKPDYGPLAGTEARVGIDNVFNSDYRDNLSPDRSLGRTFKLTLAKQFDY